ncbi:IgGFc-binding protein [Aulostomus maculatus]
MYGCQKSPNTVRIKASADVAVKSFSYKLYTADTSVVYPTTEWGTEYFIFTPSPSPYRTFKEFSVTNGNKRNKVEVFPKGSIKFQGRFYKYGSRMELDLQPYESVQLQSVYELSGTRVASQFPVAVFAGHSCTWHFSKCNHVYEQLQPVSSWGSSFIVPPLSWQKKFDSVYIQASQLTQITVHDGKHKDVFSLSRGEMKEIRYHDPETLSIQADHGIQVLLLFNGVTYLLYHYFDPFLMTILPTDRFCSSYSLEALGGFENKALIVAKTSAMAELRMDGVNLPRSVKWNKVAETDFSWAEISYKQTRDGTRHSFSSSGSPFALYSIGVSQMNGYGAPAQCLQSETGSLSCSTITCSANEVCEMNGGYPSCVPKPVERKPGVCWAMGDPHYHTFDGRNYNFMGTCTYVMAKNCGKNDNLPPFEVLAQNENRGSLRVSYVALVIVKVYDVTITIARSETGFVRIDNNLWGLPIVLNDDKLIVSQSGRSVVIETQFGLSIRYDWEHYLEVALSGSYAGKTCGLCGNFNGNPNDDFTTPSGSLADGAVAFGSSWRVPGLVKDALCRDDCVGGCERCEHSQMKMWEGDSFCGLITLIISGPFKKCHAIIDPQAYLENCKYDVCMGGGLRHFLCRALEAYTEACQNAGIQVYDWRKMARCSAKCPANSHYELCGNACPATCSDPNSPSKCKRPCVETCTCDAGFVLSGGQCVSASQCGCTYEGRYIPAGDSFWAEEGCRRRCKCLAGSRRVECQDKGCGAGKECRVVDGIRKCQANSYSTCQATGDPHYLTFDKRKFDFQGTCVYQLVALCSEDPELEPFEVLVQNDHRGSKVVSYTKLVEIKVFSLNIVITRTHKGLIMVNNELVNLPITLDGGKVSVYKSGWYAVVTTTFGLEVFFNWESAVFVTLHSNYMGAVCGLCGNYNGKPQDDLVPKNGLKPVSPADFGSSWRVAEIPGCVDGCKGVCPDCDITQKIQYEKGDFCGMLKDPNGPFRDCHAKVDPAGFFDDCVYDVCLYKGRKDVLCQSISTYTSACQNAGAKVYSWRTSQFCAVKCPVHSHFEVCATACPATCHSLAPPKNCHAGCKEGCSCDEGYILSGDHCVPFSQCGCVYEDRYYRVGQVFYPNGKCEEECKCLQDGQVDCKEFKCGPNEKCKVENGIQKCHPVGKGLCDALGDPHYRSFDGRIFDFQGTCTYTLSKSCGIEGTHLVPFSVQVENVKWDGLPTNKVVSVTKLVAVEVYGLTLIMRNNMFGVLVNGIFYNLPLNLNDGEVLIYQESIHYVIETNFGLLVTYDLVYHATVTVPGNYRGMVCGLCGNFNDLCKDVRCRVKEKCRVEYGEAVCVPDYTSTCWAWGDPHYHTFDGYNYDFQGTCKYVISKTCGNLDGLVPFSITERNDNRGNSRVSYVREVEVSVYGSNITIRKNQVGRVQVNGELLNLPLRLDGGQVVVYQYGHSAVVDTNIGLIVSYDWNWKLVIKLSSSYYSSVCGLCGNFNGKRDDELQNPAGKAVPSVIEWGESWQMPEQDKDGPCWGTCKDKCPACESNQLKLYETEVYCGALTAKTNNVFKRCHDKVDPQAFFTNCVYDVCMYKGDKKMLCQALASYSEQCREEGIIIKDWRKILGCPMACQRHSHYEECAYPCQPSCPYPEKKQTCSGACVETCVCDEGYVLSAGVCVPAKECGCSYQGRYYKPGQRFWADEACGRLCECDTTLGMVTCSKASCSSEERCMLVDGERACRPISHATCTASGDPHYQTFDGHRFNFQGTCVYQLVGLCSQNPGLVPFKVTVQNDHRGSKTVSYTKTVTFSIYGITLTINREYPYKVLLNGQLASLPLYYKNELLVFLSGWTAVVETDAGIKVTFDWRSTVSVTLPSNYQSAVCGLCGNYNGEGGDDLTMRNGQIAPDGAKLGESWQVGLVPGCSSVCHGPWCQACADSQRKEYRALKYCGIIADNAGPLRDCHSHVDPTPYLENCVFDACHYHGHHGAVCDAVEVYVAACQSLGITIRSWRTNNFCPMLCPANSHYSLCATGCPASCASLVPPTSCHRPCIEACECDEGYLLSGGSCVPVKDCGCTYDGKYYRKGDVFYPETECVDQCTCGENGAVSCQKNRCRPGEICKLLNGVKGCHAVGQGKCVASGDPHYISFDGHRFDFQGTCVYVLAKVCDDDKGQLVPFSVTQGNEKYGNGKVAVTKSVAVAVYGYVIYIQQGVAWKVILNDELFNLPLSLDNGHVSVTQEGRHIIVRTDFGLTVLYDTVYYVEVIVPSTYQGKMCGLCGNYNKNAGDDYTLPDGKQTRNVDEFGKAWVVDLPEHVCGGCGGQCPVCEEAKATLYGKRDACGIMREPDGPFKACHSKIDPATYVSHCVFDVCATDGNKDTLCNSVQAYALACQNAGVQIQPWRSSSFCPASCGQHSHYELCADTCGGTCASIIYPFSCSERCFEGCQCDAGFVFDGVRCVPMEDCGCVHNGRYLMVGQTDVDEDCKSQCECHASGLVKCEKLSCASEEFCGVIDGIRGCKVKQGHCSVKQAAHLTSFDGMSGATGALGAFEVASLCDETAKLWFRVVVDIRLCSKKGSPTVATVHVFFKDSIVSVNSEHVTWVNGRKVSLPSKVTSEISVQISEETVIIRRASAVQVNYSISQDVTVIIDSSLSGKMCGACGNYNHDSKDDMRTADGKITTDVSIVVDSWSAGDFSRCGL